MLLQPLLNEVKEGKSKGLDVPQLFIQPLLNEVKEGNPAESGGLEVPQLFIVLY